MPFKLTDRKVLITGGSRGLGAVVARSFAAEGAHVAINYFSGAEPAEALAASIRKDYSVRAITLQGDASSRADVERLVAQTVEQLGGLDVAVANSGWTRFATFGDLDDLTEAEWDRCWAANVKGPLHLVRAIKPIMDANPEGGACIVTSSIAGVSLGGSSLPYSVTKAAQLHLLKCLAKTQGARLRINAVLPGLLLTDWGNLYGEERIKMLKQAAVLQRETDLQDCADAFIMLAKNTSMTGQRVQVDSGLKVDNM